MSDVLIAGCLPPLVASYRPEVTPSYADSLVSYRRLVELQSPASNLFICETMASICEAKAACIAGLESGKPVWVALTVSDTEPGYLRSGELLSDAVEALETLGCDAILLNCSQPEAITSSWLPLTKTNLKVGAYANGFVSVADLHPGGTVEKLESRQDLGTEQYANHAMVWANNGASIIGGCCEISPAHIKAIHDKLSIEGFL